MAPWMIYASFMIRSAIQWAKGEQLIPRNNGKRSRRKARKREVGTTKAFVTRKGSLRIPGIGYQEAGIYSCMGKFHTFCINFLSGIWKHEKVILCCPDSSNPMPKVLIFRFLLFRYNFCYLFCKIKRHIAIWRGKKIFRIWQFFHVKIPWLIFETLRFDGKIQLLEFDKFSRENSLVNFWNTAIWRKIPTFRSWQFFLWKIRG